jgi:hypothetical protein
MQQVKLWPRKGIRMGLAVYSFQEMPDFNQVFIGILILAMLAGIILGWHMHKFAMRFHKFQVTERVTEVPEVPEEAEEVDEATVPNVVAGDALWKDELKVAVKAEELSELSNADLLVVCNMLNFKKLGAKPTRSAMVELLSKLETMASGPQMRYVKILARRHGVTLEPRHYLYQGS